ncbi:hypothetical protein C6569_17660 [Phreatobacter cathodiphilus]|uniref:Uncharacterized protein n=2 Tax=Phreatobacter cathodiphilus TaxID=1868589 RepID=A0A2S0NEY8_9HYPH|nr:hypothetical protein C6569_17660 [Phreatobacter cathodiphilus]
MLGGCAAIVLLLAGAAAEARPADCLVVLEGRVRMDGPCEFRPGSGGDFTITAGSVEVQVMVDPGSREGRASYVDNSPRSREALVWDVRREGACWVDRTSRICAWSVGQRPSRDGGRPGPGGGSFGGEFRGPRDALAEGPDRSPPPAPQTRMIRMDAPPGRFTVSREMRGNRLLRCVADGPSDEGLRVSYYPGAELRRVLSIPGNRAPEGAEDTLTITLEGRQPVELQARHGGTRVAVDLTDEVYSGLSEVASMQVQFASSGETRSYDLTTFGEAEAAVDGCITSYGPDPTAALGRAQPQVEERRRAPPPPPVAMAPPASPQRQGDAYRFNFARAGVWEVRRLSDEPAGRRTLGCIVDSTDPSVNNVRFGVDNRNAIIEFRDGGDMSRFPPRFRVQIQFGANTRSYTFPAQVVDEGFGPWARLMTARNFQSGIETAGELVIQTPDGEVVLPIPDGERLWPAMARCMTLIR